MSRPYLIFLILLIVTGLVLILGQGTLVPEISETGEMSLVHSLGWLALLGSSLLLGMRHRPKDAVKYAVGWIIIGVILAAVYHLFGPF